MVTLNNIISDITELATSGQENYSFSIEYEQIAYWIHEIRSKLISQALNKKQDITDIWLQEICLDMEIVDDAEGCDNKSDCKILRSVKELPNTIDNYLDNSIIRVVTISGEIISKANSFSAHYNKYNKYTSKKRNWYIKNRRLYITNDLSLEKVITYGLYEDPTELSDYCNCKDEPCYSDDGFYPVSLKMASDITDIIFNTKIKPFLAIPKDKDNDNNDEVQLTK